MTATSETPSTSESGTTATGENPLHWLDEYTAMRILSSIHPRDILSLSMTCRRDRALVLHFAEVHGDDRLLTYAIGTGWMALVQACLRSGRTTRETLLQCTDHYHLGSVMGVHPSAPWRFHADKWCTTEKGLCMVNFLLAQDPAPEDPSGPSHDGLIRLCAAVGNLPMLQRLLDWPSNRVKWRQCGLCIAVEAAIQNDQEHVLRWLRSGPAATHRPEGNDDWTEMLRMAILCNSVRSAIFIGVEWPCDLCEENFGILDVLSQRRDGLPIGGRQRFEVTASHWQRVLRALVAQMRRGRARDPVLHDKLLRHREVVRGQLAKYPETAGDFTAIEAALSEALAAIYGEDPRSASSLVT